MSKQIEPYWIGHPACDSPRALELKIIQRRDDLVVVAAVEDPGLSYEYDEHAVVKLDGEYYALQTSGCSCPSPTETWHVAFGPAPLQEVIEHYQKGDYEGYTLPTFMEAEFIKTLVAETVKEGA